MPHRPKAIAAAVLFIALHAAAAPLPAALQNALDTAVLDYEAGRLAQAQQAFTALSQRGVAAASYNLAVMHLKRQLPQPSTSEAQRLLLRAAAGGFVTAQFMLGRAFENGDFGARDLPQAVQWYRQAAESGSAEAQLEVATALYLGRGVDRDATRAAHWFREAAKAGDIGAMYLLASLYEQGDGVSQDLRLARYWYGVAASNGDDAAPGKLREIDAKLAAPGTPAPATAPP